MILKCKTCGQEFDAKRKDTEYCKTCKAKRRSLQTMLCRKRHHPEVELGVGSGNSSKNKAGLSNHNTTTGIMVYRHLISVDKCAVCGSTENLCVHHIDHDRTHNTPDNLMCLCKKCHQKHHCVRDPHTGRFTSVKRLQTNTEVTE